MISSPKSVGLRTSMAASRTVLVKGTEQNPLEHIMGVPILLKDKHTGLLAVWRSGIGTEFTRRELDFLARLAQQTAVAIENARLLDEARRALSESHALFDKYTQQEWSNFARQAKQTGYLFDGKQVTPLDHTARRDLTRAAIQTGSLTLEKESASIAIPIKLRGQTIGVLDVRSKKGARSWKQDEISMLEAAAERAALALENARLFEELERRNRELSEALEQQTATADVLRVIAASPTDLQGPSRPVAPRTSRRATRPPRAGRWPPRRARGSGG